MNTEITLATIDDLIKAMPPRIPNAARINQRTLDALRRRISLPADDMPFPEIKISVAEGMPDGTIAFGWDIPGGGFELNVLYRFADWK